MLATRKITQAIRQLRRNTTRPGRRTDNTNPRNPARPAPDETPRSSEQAPLLAAATARGAAAGATNALLTWLLHRWGDN
ncbi:hypothetical protein [Kitasatospora herbaricolor]|uniref:hypothetical protein n=1 Tax=Kitasatospora herbaricolor TaxID=68217 RepID=UPI0036D8489F